MRVFIITFACFVVTLAQVPQHCETPPVWNGYEIGSDYDSKFERRNTVEYDMPNERVRMVDQDNYNGTFEMYENLYLHKNRTHYRVNLRTRQCIHIPLNEPFRPFEVPTDARFVGEFVAGSTAVPAAGVVVNLFSGLDEYRGGNFTIGVTSVDCIPFFYGHFSERFGFYHAEWYNIVLGVDPGVFNIPSECLEL